jgi:spore coat protein U-like protein
VRYNFFGSYIAFVSSYFILSGSAVAGTATANMTVTATVANTCTIATVTNVSFGTIPGYFTSAINATTNGEISVQCTSGDSYNITIGTGAHSTVNFRQMADSTATYFIEYVLYSDSGFSTKWGNNTTQFGNAVLGTGTGSVQLYTVYAQIPIQALTPAPIAASYTDTVLITITY